MPNCFVAIFSLFAPFLRREQRLPPVLCKFLSMGLLLLLRRAIVLRVHLLFNFFWQEREPSLSLNCFFFFFVRPLYLPEHSEPSLP